ncbi:MAG TPA: hypothetical protein VFO35_00770 [Steroidobacteraceae bacterium]|nr:hypothetical protein [Steroidobacteraceae bacterium]
MQVIRTVLRAIPLCTAILFAAGCEQQQPMVWVLEGPQQVTLTASASAKTVKVGETVVLHAQRRTVGKWKQIPRDQLTPGQCWLYTAPPEFEQEVAASIDWEVMPENAVRFDNAVRMDQTRIATMVVRGRVSLRPLTTVRCEKDRIEEGDPIRLEVL